VRQVDDELMQRLKEGTTPIVVQEFIAGREVRVHTVLDLNFATEVISSDIDYRFQNEGNHYRATSLPDAITALCRKVAASEGLTIGGFDFRVTRGGQWYCLEVNPVPTFLPYEMSTGQPIGNAVLDAFSDSRAARCAKPCAGGRSDDV